MEHSEKEKMSERLAKEVLGWSFCKSSFEQYEPSCWYGGETVVWGPQFNPFEDISAAMKLLEAKEIESWAMKWNSEEKNFVCQIQAFGDRRIEFGKELADTITRVVIESFFE